MTKFKKYVMEISETESYYLLDLFNQITFDDDLTSEEAIALQKIIVPMLYMVENELFQEAHSFFNLELEKYNE